MCDRPRLKCYVCDASECQMPVDDMRVCKNAIQVNLLLPYKNFIIFRWFRFLLALIEIGVHYFDNANSVGNLVYVTLMASRVYLVDALRPKKAYRSTATTTHAHRIIIRSAMHPANIISNAVRVTIATMAHFLNCHPFKMRTMNRLESVRLETICYC